MNFAKILVCEQVLSAEEIPILDKMQPVELQHHISKAYLDLLAVREFDKHLKVNYKDLHLIFMQLADRSDEEDFCKLNQPGTAEESNVSRRKTSTPMRYVPREDRPEVKLITESLGQKKFQQYQKRKSGFDVVRNAAPKSLALTAE